MRRGIFIPILIFLLSLCVHAQDLPAKIRGYRVYNAQISINGNSGSDAVVSIGEPTVTDVSITGITFDIGAEIKSLAQSGKVDFLTFRDLRVNGVVVTVEEYRHLFAFRKGATIRLPRSASIFLPTTQILHAAWNEMRDSKREWTVTGRVFVFGRFRRFGFDHKRVVPIDIHLTIPNPLISTAAATAPR